MSGSSDLFGNDPTDYSTAGGGSVATLVDSSTGLNSGWSFDIPKTSDTASTNALQSMAPVTAANTSSGSDWSSFWGGIASSIAGKGASVLAQQYGPSPSTPTTPLPPPPQNPNRTLLLLALVVGAVLLVTHEAG